MANVRELFSRLFVYVLLFEQSIVSGQTQRSYEQVRGDITRLLEQAMARRQGMVEQEYQEAAFAVVAWIDETIMKLSSWEHVDRWIRAPLQVEYYQRQNAGEELFERLRKLRSDQKEIREIYYLALGLGFTGRYSSGVEDERTLAQIRHEQAQHLPLRLEQVQRLDKITPQPYEMTPPLPEPIKPPWTHLLLNAGLALLVVVPLALLLIIWFMPRLPVQQFELTVRKSGSGSGIVTSADHGINCGADCARKYDQGTEIVLTAVAEAGSVFSQWSGDTDCANGKIKLVADKNCTAVFDRERWPDEAIRKNILERLANQPCAKIAVAVQGGVVSLSGRVARETQRDEVRNLAQSTQDVSQVNETFEIIPRPFCQVLDLVEPLKEQGEKQGVGLVMRLDKTGNRPVYVKGDNLILDLQAPTKFASYFYIDYYAAGTPLAVAHLVPNQQEKIQAMAPGNALRVDLHRLGFQIQEPFGLDLITVIASKTPLFPTPRSDEEPVEGYLNALRRALPSEVSTSEVAAMFSFITTRER